MPSKTIIDASKSLAIHVLGAGKGESIVLAWPENRWGVVDCYARSLTDHSTNPTLRFLRQKGVTELEFLCLTHPHDDHFRGMSQLLEQLNVKYFWRFAGISARDLKLLAKILVVESERGGNGHEQENANDFVRTMELVNERREKKQLKQKTVTGFQQLYPIPFDSTSPFQVSSFAPHGNQVGHYERSLAAGIGENGQLRKSPPQVSHNEVSVGLVVEFGKTRVVLGGDVEKAAWTDSRQEHAREHFFADAVKVSHHGSDTGIVPDLWADISGRKKPIAVIAPYRRFRLPKAEALQHIKEHSSKVFLTCEIEHPNTPCPTGPHLKSRLYLRGKLKASASLPEGECGRCSLFFDTEGNCIDEDFDRPAYEYVVDE